MEACNIVKEESRFTASCELCWMTVDLVCPYVVLLLKILHDWTSNKASCFVFLLPETKPSASTWSVLIF